MPTSPTDLIHPKIIAALSNILSYFFQFSLYVAIAVLIFLGVSYIINKEEGIKKAHNWLRYLAIGIVVVFLSRILIQTIYLLLIIDNP